MCAAATQAQLAGPRPWGTRGMGWSRTLLSAVLPASLCGLILGSLSLPLSYFLSAMCRRGKGMASRARDPD